MFSTSLGNSLCYFGLRPIVYSMRFLVSSSFYDTRRDVDFCGHFVLSQATCGDVLGCEWWCIRPYPLRCKSLE